MSLMVKLVVVPSRRQALVVASTGIHGELRSGGPTPTAATNVHTNVMASEAWMGHTLARSASSEQFRREHHDHRNRCFGRRHRGRRRCHHRLLQTAPAEGRRSARAAPGEHGASDRYHVAAETSGSGTAEGNSNTAQEHGTRAQESHSETCRGGTELKAAVPADAKATKPAADADPVGAASPPPPPPPAPAAAPKPRVAATAGLSGSSDDDDDVADDDEGLWGPQSKRHMAETAAITGPNGDTTVASTISVSAVPMSVLVPPNLPKHSLGAKLLTSCSGGSFERLTQFPLIVTESHRIAAAKHRGSNPHGLSEDEIFAVVLYTYDLGPRSTQADGSDNFYFVVNVVIRKAKIEGPAVLEPLKAYFECFDSVWHKLPQVRGRYFRGVPRASWALVRGAYHVGRPIEWTAITSVSKNAGVAERFAAKDGAGGDRLRHQDQRRARCSVVFRGSSGRRGDLIAEHTVHGGLGADGRAAEAAGCWSRRARAGGEGYALLLLASRSDVLPPERFAGSVRGADLSRPRIIGIQAPVADPPFSN
jgi:hypothetical protein